MVNFVLLLMSYNVTKMRVFQLSGPTGPANSHGIADTETQRSVEASSYDTGRSNLEQIDRPIQPYPANAQRSLRRSSASASMGAAAVAAVAAVLGAEQGVSYTNQDSPQQR